MKHLLPQILEALYAGDNKTAKRLMREYLEWKIHEMD